MGKAMNAADEGQRYLVRAWGWPKRSHVATVGYAEQIKGADRMARAAISAPSCEKAEILDRMYSRHPHEGKIIATYTPPSRTPASSIETKAD